MTSTQSTPNSEGTASTSAKAQQPAAAEKPAGTARATLHYTLLRLALFVGTFAVLSVLAWVGVIPEGIGKSNPLWLFALAILISAPLSLVLLRKQRDAMSEQIVPKVENFKGRIVENRSRED